MVLRQERCTILFFSLLMKFLNSFSHSLSVFALFNFYIWIKYNLWIHLDFLLLISFPSNLTINIFFTTAVSDYFPPRVLKFDPLDMKQGIIPRLTDNESKIWRENIGNGGWMCSHRVCIVSRTAWEFLITLLFISR